MTTEYSKLQDLMDAFCLENPVKEPTRFKSTVHTTIDLIVTNQKSLFMIFKCMRKRFVWFSQIDHHHTKKKYN